MVTKMQSLIREGKRRNESFGTGVLSGKYGRTLGGRGECPAAQVVHCAGGLEGWVQECTMGRSTAAFHSGQAGGDLAL